MSDKPIIFSAPMVNAILDKRKTQTRRVIKPQPKGWAPEIFVDGVTWGWCINGDMDYSERIRCPYQVGMKLWVRETWLENAFGRYLYKADWARGGPEEGFEHSGWGWKSPMFMPRKASRITLEVTGVRAERVQDITEEDAKAEGVGTAVRAQLHGMSDMDAMPLDGIGLKASYRNTFATLWDSINGEKYPWASNVWVWAITFRRIDDNPATLARHWPDMHDVEDGTDVFAQHPVAGEGEG